MARRRRRYGSYVQIPGLAGLMDSLKSNVKGIDVLVGAALGAVLGPMLQGFLANNKFMQQELADPTSILSKINPYIPALASSAAGVGLYFAQSKSGRGTGHMIGALAAGAALAAPEVKKSLKLGDVVSLPLYGRYGAYGTLVDEATPRIGPGAYGGLLVDEPGHAMSDGNLAQLAAYSMSENEGADMESLMESY